MGFVMYASTNTRNLPLVIINGYAFRVTRGYARQAQKKEEGKTNGTVRTVPKIAIRNTK